MSDTQPMNFADFDTVPRTDTPPTCYARKASDADADWIVAIRDYYRQGYTLEEATASVRAQIEADPTPAWPNGPKGSQSSSPEGLEKIVARVTELLNSFYSAADKRVVADPARE